MNKSAREMFEELGYEFINHKAIIYRGKHETGRLIRIAFFDNKKILITESIGLEELQAINQQCKELGWLDECV